MTEEHGAEPSRPYVIITQDPQAEKKTYIMTEEHRAELMVIITQDPHAAVGGTDSSVVATAAHTSRAAALWLTV
jgi:hypothetical protein